MRNNRYDYLIILIIAVFIFGYLKSPLYPSRILTIVLLPDIIGMTRKCKICIPTYVKNFFIIWILFSSISILWSYDRINGIKVFFYNICNILTFLSIYLYSQKANNPIRSIFIGWIILFSLTVPIACYEFTSGMHLSNALQDDDLTISSADGFRMQRMFAAVSYGNLNTYNVVICYCLIFILTSFFYFKKKIIHILLWILLLVSVIIILFNASRGAFLCLFVGLIVFMSYLFKQKIISKYFIFLMLGGAAFFLYTYAELFMGQLLGRLVTANIVEDNSRTEIYGRGLTALVETLGLGVGSGGIAEALRRLSPNGIAAMHNMYLEFLVQYGIIPFIFYMIFLYKILTGLYKSKQIYVRFLSVVILALSFPLFVINSNYLLNSELWLFLGSIFTILIISKNTCRYIDNCYEN